MGPVRTIVVALDFTIESEPALVRAARLAVRCAARLHVVHVAPQRLGSERPLDPVDDAAVRTRLKRFAADALGTSTDAGEPVAGDRTTWAVTGGTSVSGSVLQYAHSVGADILVVGAHGRSGVNRMLLGSVAGGCIAQASCPVLTVPHEAEAHGPSPTTPVLAAIDFSVQSRAVLGAARQLADTFGAPLELVHVVRDRGPYTGLLPSALSLREVDPGRAVRVENRLARFSGDTAVADVHVALGSPSRQVALVAAARRAGALAMGTNGRPGVAQTLVGSTVNATLQRAGCAILTVGTTEPQEQSTERYAATT